MTSARDHGGGLDAAMARFGGTRKDWIDLSTGINPIAYPLGTIESHVWATLPDRVAHDRLIAAARRFWRVPQDAQIIVANGASALIAALPALSPDTDAYIPGPTYNEHGAAFAAHQKLRHGDDPKAQAHVYVHPNNPDGRLWPGAAVGGRALTIIDESFCDVTPDQSHIARSHEDGVIVLKSFGKFWGLAGLRLGFAIARKSTFALAPRPDADADAPRAHLADLLGPWAVSGPALCIGTRALGDLEWAAKTRRRLTRDAARLDAIAQSHNMVLAGGTDLFRLYDVGDAMHAQAQLARQHIWTRTFPYSKRWIRMGLPRPEQFARIERAFALGMG